MTITSYRTCTCGELSLKNINSNATLAGWVHSRRDHGGVIFIDLRDRYGITQVVFNPEFSKETHSIADSLRREDVIQVTGKVEQRAKGMENPRLASGEIEVFASKLEILNRSETPPIEIDDRKEAGEDYRLKYRYLDLRRPCMQERLLTRHKAVTAVREYMNSLSFLEIETPMLVKTTPGGARVFKVPSRTHPGKFYALPESPQLYKQLLMVAGCDRYYQIARCLRDEDLRADRQPEFTQIDIEMSFVDENDVQAVIEGLLKNMFKQAAGIELATPFQRLSYKEAMERFGSDKPDLRFGLELKEVTDIAKKSTFGVFKDAESVKCLSVEGGAKFSRKDIEELEAFVKVYKARGLAYLKASGGKLESSIAKYFSEDVLKELALKTGTKDGDILLFVADTLDVVFASLGALRVELGKKLKLFNPKEFMFCWIVDFPLYEQVDGKWEARHHIFTMPKPEDFQYLETEPSKVRGKLYDIVLNGVEIGGGSIRIHKKDIQEMTLKVIGLSYEEARKRFDFLLEAFQYGAPPHGGIALGLDRCVALMSGLNDIREVIAFPKNKAAENPMDGSPQDWLMSQLKELNLKTEFINKE